MGLLEIVAIIKMCGYGALGVSALVAVIGAFKKDNKANSYKEEDIKSFCTNTNLLRQRAEDKEFILPKVKEIIENDRVIEMHFESNYFSISDFESRKEMFLNNFKRARDINIIYGADRTIIVQLFKKTMQEQYAYNVKLGDFATSVFLGFDKFENEIWGNLDKHLMIGGSTGQGKSSFLNTLILNRLYYNKQCSRADAKVELKLIDLKGTEFNIFEDILNIEIGQTVEDSINILDNIKTEIENRKKLFKRLKAKNLEEYNLNATKKLNYIFLIIDEYACFQEMIEDKKVKEKLISDLRQISSIARSFGIKIICASQKTGISAGAMDSFFRSQISSNLIVGFRVQDDNTSKTIIFKEGLENLKRPGEAIAIIKGTEQHIQTMYISDSELNARLNKDIKSSI